MLGRGFYSRSCDVCQEWVQTTELMDAFKFEREHDECQDYQDERNAAHGVMLEAGLTNFDYEIDIRYDMAITRDRMLILSTPTPDGIQVVKWIDLRGHQGDERNMLAAELVARRFVSKLREVR